MILLPCLEITVAPLKDQFRTMSRTGAVHAYLDLSHLLVCLVLQVLTLLFQLVHLALGGMQLFPGLRQVCLAGCQVLPHALCLQLCCCKGCLCFFPGSSPLPMQHRIKYQQAGQSSHCMHQIKQNLKARKQPLDMQGVVGLVVE